MEQEREKLQFAFRQETSLPEFRTRAERADYRKASIRANYLIGSDAALAEHLGMTVQSVRQTRKRLGLSKSGYILENVLEKKSKRVRGYFGTNAFGEPINKYGEVRKHKAVA